MPGLVPHLALLLWLAGALVSAAAEPSLTVQFEDALATQEWTLVKTGVLPAWQPADQSNALPIQLWLTDANTGERAPLKPSAHFLAENRLRWGGRTLGLDWVLVLDGATNNELSVSGQLKSGMPRVVSLEAGITLPDDGSPAATSTGPTLQQRGLEWTITSDPGQPRIHQGTTDATSNWLGLRYFLTMDPSPEQQGGRASFRFNLQVHPELNAPPPETNNPPEPPQETGWTGADQDLTATLAALVRARALGQTNSTNLPLPGLRRPDEPVFAAVNKNHLVSVENETALEIILHNLTDQPQPYELSGHGDFATPVLQGVLQAGESRLASLPILSMEPGQGTVSARVEAGGFRCLEAPVQVTFLPAQANLARDSRVEVEADSTFSGSTILALTDGLSPTNLERGLPRSWASDETDAAHWVRLTFPQATAISELRLLWNFADGRHYTSRRGEVSGWTGTGEHVLLTTVNQMDDQAETRLEFETIQLKAIEFRQPRGGGSPHRPNLLWLNELEVR
jgi:hypothetical protein